MSDQSLKKGDLVNIQPRDEPGVKYREGGLARIFRIREDNTYDLDWVMGGRAMKVSRQEFTMTEPSSIKKDDSSTTSRPRRAQRKPKKLASSSSSTDENNNKSKGNSSNKSSNNNNNSDKKKNTNKNNKATSKRKKSTNDSTKSSDSHKKNNPKSNSATTAVNKSGDSLFERHLREFERCLQRLEKVDPYGFFLGPPLPGFEEEYIKTGEIVQFSEEAPFNWTVVRQRMELDRYILIRSTTNKKNGSTTQQKQIDWNTFKYDVERMCRNAMTRDTHPGMPTPGTLRYASKKILNVMEQICAKTGQRQKSEIDKDEGYHKFLPLLNNNYEPAMQGSWQKTAYPERRYQRLPSSSVLCDGLSDVQDQRSAIYEMKTSLPDSFVGLSYSYNDKGQSEEWMKSVTKNDFAKVIKAQVKTAMDILLLSVQDRVMTENKILHKPEVQSVNWLDGNRLITSNDDAHTNYDENSCLKEQQNHLHISNSSAVTPNNPSFEPQVAEQPVWGIDCYTRKNVLNCIEIEYSSQVSLQFVEKWLLPAINSCPVDVAHNMNYAAQLLEGLISTEKEDGRNVFPNKALFQRINQSGPPWLKQAARLLRLATETLGDNAFRIHPKGHGSVVLKKEGIPPNTLVTHYRGEVYPPWRWGEKLDAIEQTQIRLGLRPNLPDFYNMALERPRADPRGYGLLFVDASRKAGLGSSFSHSCDPSCEVKVVAVNGQLSLAITSLRHIDCGEELTFDYNAVTESVNEYHSAICLCGNTKCRGSFLHFATADCYQEVLNRNSPIAVRFSSLVKGCMKQVMSREDEQILENHGFRTAAFGAVSFNHHHCGNKSLSSVENIPIWLRTFTADTLRYIEYERRALPIALICNHITKKSHNELNSKSYERIQDNDEKKKKLKNKSKDRKKSENKANQEQKLDKEKESHKQKKSSDDKPIPGSKPESLFFYYSRQNKESFIETLKEQGITDLKGLELQRAIQKIAGTSWRNLSDEKKQEWKDRVYKEWEEKGGLEKARLEEERKKQVEVSKFREDNLKDTSNLKEMKRKNINDEKGKDSKKQKVSKSKDPFDSKNISFEAADAEGWSAMEQRVHQLTQTLSRVGRVLDRHRDSTYNENERNSRCSATPLSLRNKSHSPIIIMKDFDIIKYIWSNPDGIVQTFLRIVREETWLSHSLVRSINKVAKRYDTLSQYISSNGNVNKYSTNLKKKKISTSAEARKQLSKALLKFRKCILKHLKHIDDEFKNHRNEEARRKRKLNKDKVSKKKVLEKKSKNEEVVIESSSITCTSLFDKSLPNTSLLDTKGCSLSLVTESSSDTTNLPTNQLDEKDEKNNMKSKNEMNLKDQEPASSEQRTEKELSPKENTRLSGSQVSITNFFPQVSKSNNNFSALKTNQKLLSKKFFGETPSETSSSTPDPNCLLAIRNTSKCQNDHTEHCTFQTSISRDENNSKINQLYETKKINIEAVDRSKLDVHNIKEDEKNEEFLGTKIDWVEEWQHRYKLQSIADLLLFYAHTSTFFELNPYISFESSPIEVYARELGNAVPKSVVEVAKSVKTEKVGETTNVHKNIIASMEQKELKDRKDICKPDDIVTNVTVKYSGDYVLSLLLQWYTGGIGLKSGLPETLGCISLPSARGCWCDKPFAKEVKRETEIKCKPECLTEYEADVRPLLIEWFEDRVKRGSPWPEEISKYFVESNVVDGNKSQYLPLGSPILDLLVTGDDSNIQLVLLKLKKQTIDSSLTNNENPSNEDDYKSTEEKLKSKVDESMPAQAVANWVQCENPNCMKWRKLPWHVDLDLLPDKFYCKDNIWNPESNTCESPEDPWDDCDAPVKFNDSTTEMQEDMFKIGAFFDVMREGKDKFVKATVVDTDFSSELRRVKFHFARMMNKFDEWIPIDSPRIAPYLSYSRLVPIGEKISSSNTNDKIQSVNDINCKKNQKHNSKESSRKKIKKKEVEMKEQSSDGTSFPQKKRVKVKCKSSKSEIKKHNDKTNFLNDTKSDEKIKNNVTVKRELPSSKDIKSEIQTDVPLYFSDEKSLRREKVKKKCFDSKCKMNPSKNPTFSQVSKSSHDHDIKCMDEDTSMSFVSTGTKRSSQTISNVQNCRLSTLDNKSFETKTIEDFLTSSGMTIPRKKKKCINEVVPTISSSAVKKQKILPLTHNFKMVP